MKTSLTKHVLYPVLFFFCLGAVNAQTTSTYTGVYNLLQAKCASCHNSTTTSGNLDLSGTASQVYEHCEPCSFERNSCYPRR
jgi:hypothetical protein